MCIVPFIESLLSARMCGAVLVRSQISRCVVLTCSGKTVSFCVLDISRCHVIKINFLLLFLFSSSPSFFFIECRENKYLQKSSVSRVCAIAGFFISIPIFLTGSKSEISTCHIHRTRQRTVINIYIVSRILNFILVSSHKRIQVSFCTHSPNSTQRQPSSQAY